VVKAKAVEKAPPIMVCSKADIVGNVYFGEGCVVHNNATIQADGGDIIFGEYCIIEDHVRIVNQPRRDRENNVVKKTMKIGNYNLFEIGC
jgi:dynactin-6